MKPLKRFVAFFTLSAVFTACTSGIINGADMTQSDLQYLEKIGLKSEEEAILLFDAQSDHQTGGSLITNQRLASYWIEPDKNINNIHSAFYGEIDTLVTKDLTTKLTYASYIQVIKKDGAEFKVYVDDDKENTKKFFEKAIAEWEKHKE